MDTFLPNGYKTPATTGNYMKFEDGKNKFRVLGSAIIGYEWWKDTEEGRRPMRVKEYSQVPSGTENVRHFWAFPVWNYQDMRIQILELTQKSIMRAIENLVNDEDWGNPRYYDITVTKTGEKLNTEYSVTPSPARELDSQVQELYKKTHIDLTKLYEGLDPFAQEMKEMETVDPDDVPPFD